MDNKDEVKLPDGFTVDGSGSKIPAVVNINNQHMSSDEKLSEAAEHYISNHPRGKIDADFGQKEEKKRSDSLPLVDRSMHEDEFNLFAPSQMKVRPSDSSIGARVNRQGHLTIDSAQLNY